MHHTESRKHRGTETSIKDFRVSVLPCWLLLDLWQIVAPVVLHVATPRQPAALTGCATEWSAGQKPRTTLCGSRCDLRGCRAAEHRFERRGERTEVEQARKLAAELGVAHQVRWVPPQPECLRMFVEQLAYLGWTALRRDDVMLGVLPFFHTFGYTITLWAMLAMGVGAVYHSHPLEARVIGPSSVLARVVAARASVGYDWYVRIEQGRGRLTVRDPAALKGYVY